MRVKDLMKLHEADGWYFTRQSGSHRIFSHKTKKGIVVVPVHGGDIPKALSNRY
ncbi:MAG: type II toxin-antitoxin system HicA family toxin [Pyrinomonadaceae bacterium]